MGGHWVYIVCITVIFLFGFVIFFGAPYLPTLKRQQQVILELTNPKKDQTVLELGSGDGAVMLFLAKQGIKVVGIELNPILFIISYVRLLPYRKYAKVKWGNFWKTSFSSYDVLYVFLQDRFMERLHKKIVSEIKKPVILASFTFRMPNKTPDSEREGIFVYKYLP